MSALTRDAVTGEAQFILSSLRENAKLGRSNKLGDVKATLEPAVSLEFDTYFFFLRKFHYIAMDREAQLKLTDAGDKVVDGAQVDRFTSEVADFFAEHIGPADESTEANVQVDELLPPVPAEALFEESPVVTSQPSRKKPVPSDDASTTAPHPTFSVRVEVPEVRREVPFPAPPPSSWGAPQNVLAQPPQPKGTDIDLRYVKFDPIGSGPLGTVFKGRHNALGLDVAVKELKDIFGYFSFLQRGEVIKRLKKELCAQAQVRHPGIVAILDQNTDVARPYFITELLYGSLRERLDVSGGGLDVKLAIRYFLQIVYALRAAHQTGLVHHNLKPENVLFDAWGNAKLGDFGLARVIEVDTSKGMPQVIVGTSGMAYMSPELVSRHKDADASADVYAVGIMLYELLTGLIPGRRSPLPSEVNSEVPSKLDPIFDKMTQDRCEQRYPDFDAVLDDFYGAFSDGEFLTRGDLISWTERVTT